MKKTLECLSRIVKESEVPADKDTVGIGPHSVFSLDESELEISSPR
jgi:hypothetical protein